MIGILALQGGVRAHERALDRLGLEHRRVTLPDHLDGCDGLILPGGETTTMLKLMAAYDLFEPLADYGRSGKPVLGTCAGAILMCAQIQAVEQVGFGWVPAVIRRNGYGSQRESFREPVDIPAWGISDLDVLYIRAPRFTEIDPAVTVLSERHGEVTGITYRRFTAVTYHPELIEDERFHRAWHAHAFSTLVAG